MSATYKTEDGATVREGDRVYNYYDMKPGKIGEPCFGDRGWFEFHGDDGRRSILNGQRVCTMEFAARRGFRGAKVEGS